MRVLGLACGTSAEYDDNEIASHSGHDAAAALLEDGRVLAAIEEERLSRLKHSNFFPVRAASRCLELAGLAPGDLDAVAVAFSEGFADDFARRRFLADPRCPDSTGRAFVAGLVRRFLGWDVAERIRFTSHHVAHAWSVFYPSPFQESLVVVLDGVGEDGKGGFASGLVATGRGGRLEVERTFSLDDSLGLFYQRMIEVAGFGIFEEYKVMALASRGDARVHAPFFSSMIELLPEGGFRLAPPSRQLALLAQAGLAGRARRREEPLSGWHADFAAALQRALESAVLHVLEFHRARTGCRTLCFAGGVGLNSVLNGRILESGLFEEARFHPASHDAGNALGAALAVVVGEKGRPAGCDLGPVSWGAPIPDDDRVAGELGKWREFLTFAPLGGAARVAELLAGGEVLGWVRGRSEFGPRALGHRSILADPRDARLRDRINREIKGRESFRPLAPAVPLERVRDFFELPAAGANLSHMNVVVRVRPDRRETLAGVTHADGTARIQTVARDEEPEFWELLQAFGQKTGVPVLLNTSFNRAGEPIVDSVEDAIASFLNMGLDRLAIGGWLVERRPAGDFANAVLPLAVGLAPHRKLVRRASAALPWGGPPRYAVESTAARWFDEVRLEISRPVFELLLAADGRSAVGELRDRCGLEEGTWGAVADELARLWRRRAIVLRPA